MKFCFVLVLSLLSSFVYAVDCEPNTGFTPNAIGSKLYSFENANGTVDAYWCPSTSTTPGKITYKPQYHIVLNKYRNLTYGIEAFRRIASTSNFLDAFNGEITAAKILPQGVIETYQYAELNYLGCLGLTKTPYIVPIDPLPANWCGPEPVMPIQNDTFKTPQSGSFSLFNYSNGRLTGLISGRKASPNVLCNCTAAKALSLNVTYCALANGYATEVTACIKAQ